MSHASSTPSSYIPLHRGKAGGKYGNQGAWGDAAQATLALLKLAKEIADSVVGEAGHATARAVFDRLCMETDDRASAEPAPTSMH